MATRIHGRRLNRIWVDEFTHKDDGLKEFAVWVEHNFDTDSFQVTKIELFDPHKSYPASMSGTVRAKDELDAFNFLNSRYGEGAKF